MTVEERFESIERTPNVIVQAQMRHTENVAELTRMFSQYMESANARMQRTKDRIERIEEDLDGLIRAIPRHHSNGKTNL